MPEEREFAENIESLIENGVGSLLKDPEIAGACKGWLREELGCKPPVNHGLFFCFRKALDFAGKGTKDAAGSRLFALAQNNETIGRFLNFLADTSRAASERNALKARLLEAYNHDRSDEDLRADAATPFDVLNALRQGQLLEGLQDQFGGSFGGLLGDIRDEHDRQKRALTEVATSWSKNERADQSAVTAVKYDADMYPLVGRDDELDTLGAFLGDLSLAGPKHIFRWMCIIGEGGEGKTRLAFDYVTKFLPENWVGGLLRRSSLEKLNTWQNWTPSAPTLFVVDYPAQNPKLVGEVLETFHARIADFKEPVRVLLLERNTSGPWYEEMLGAKASSEKLKNHIFLRDQYESGWHLAPLKPQFIVELMAARFRRAGLEVPEGEVLYEAAAKVDRRPIRIPDEVRFELMKSGIPAEKIPTKMNQPPRALFAVATAELAVRRLGDEDAEDAAFPEFTKDEVLASILRRERSEIWKNALPENAPNRDSLLAAHEMLLALATLMRGISRDQVEECRDEVKELLPGLDFKSLVPWNRALIDRMGSSDPDRYLSGLEPDLLGEYHLLSLMKGPLSQRQIMAFMADGLRLAPDQAGLTLFLTLRDYPDDLAALSFLNPGHQISRDASLAWMRVLKNIVSSFGEAGAFDDMETALTIALEIQTAFPEDEHIALEEMKALMNGVTDTGAHQDWDRMDRLVGRAQMLQAAFPEDEHIALEEMKALVNGVNHTGAHQDWGRMDRLVSRAQTLQADFPEDQSITLHEMKALFNGVNHTGAHQDWDRMDRLVDRAQMLQTAFPENQGIALHEMKALASGVTDTGAHKDWDRMDRLVERFCLLAQSIEPEGEHVDKFLTLVIGSYLFLNRAPDRHGASSSKARIGAVLMSGPVLGVMVHSEEYVGAGFAAIKNALMTCDGLEASDAFSELLRQSDMTLDDLPDFPEE